MIPRSQVTVSSMLLRVLAGLRRRSSQPRRRIVLYTRGRGLKVRGHLCVEAGRAHKIISYRCLKTWAIFLPASSV